VLVICQKPTCESNAAQKMKPRIPILQHIGDSAIVTGAETEVMITVAELFTGGKLAEAQGEPLASVFPFVDESTHRYAGTTNRTTF
jgi:hypothetical protein